jgi:two-component system KDP operon response regulator KdpE
MVPFWILVPQHSMSLIFIADSDPIAFAAAREALGRFYEVEIFVDAATARRACVKRLPDLLIVSQDLAGLQECNLCVALREQTRTRAIRILALVERGGGRRAHLEDVSMKADDCLEKPFRTSALLIRVRSLLRRESAFDSSPIRHVDDLTLNRAKKSAECDGEDLHLTPAEFHLLWTLASDPSRRFHRQDLCLGAAEATPTDVEDLRRTLKSLRNKVASVRQRIRTSRSGRYFYEGPRF